MAAVASPPTVGITINGVDLQVPAGELIVESVKRIGLEIPIFCYHPRMKAVGMCRMCLVELGYKGQDGTVKMMPKPQAGCTLPASEGMVIVTDSEKLHRDRKGVLEFLLINHPLDCPICDRGGECPLQNNTLFYGPSTSRFLELKRHLPKAYPLSKYVTLDLERCIQCGRCVRFTEEISGDSELAFRFRGAEMQPSTFELRDFQSKFSGNVIEICPVGALTNSNYRFRARPWDLETKPAVCTVCSNGCNIWFDYRVDKMVRINGRTNEAVNEEWTCDRGKFGHEFYNSDKRLTRPLLRNGSTLEETDWAGVNTAIVEAFSSAKGKVAGLGGSTVSNEAAYLFKKLFNDHFESPNIDHRWTRHLPTEAQSLKSVLGIDEVHSTLESLENATSILSFGASLADELPIAFLRVRKAWFKNGAKVIVACDRETDADSFAYLVLRYKPGTEHALASSLLAAMVQSGAATVPDATSRALAAFSPDKAEILTGVSADSVRHAASLIGRGSVVISARSLLDTPEAQDTLESLGGLAMVSGAAFNCFALESNGEGARRLGLLPGKDGMDTNQILKACANGEVKALWLLDVDPFERCADRGLVEAALENVEFLVYQGVMDCEAVRYASVVLPMAAPAEQDGTFTNLEGRVQRMAPVLPLREQVKPAWRAISEIMLRTKAGTPYFSSAEVMDAIGRDFAEFGGAAYESLPAEGSVL